jgi:hypothetical protein
MTGLNVLAARTIRLASPLVYLLLGLFVSFGACLTKLNPLETDHQSSMKGIPLDVKVLVPEQI